MDYQSGTGLPHSKFSPQKIPLNVLPISRVDSIEQAGKIETVPGETMEIALMADEIRPVDEAAAGGDHTTRLIVRAKAGDATAFDQIVVSHQRRIIGLAWRMLGNAEDARDAAQETFLRVYKHLNRFDPTLDFAGWLYRIAVNVCRDLARRRRRDHSSFEVVIEAGTMAEPSSPDDTESAALVAEEHAILRRALATLPEKKRAAIVLRDLEGLTTEEVAQILGSSQTTVRSQICSARVKINAFRDRLLKR
jgi:RNA polymerase sigma-70 factor (ECF subfamily)